MREARKPEGSAEAYYPQVQERLNAIAAIEKELLEQVKANAQLVTLIGKQQDELRRKEDELAAATRVVAHQLSVLTQEIQSPDRTAQVTAELARVSKTLEELKTGGNAAQGEGMQQALVLVAQELANVSRKVGEEKQSRATEPAAGGEGVAIALTMMAQKLDEYVQLQKRASEITLQEIAELKARLSPTPQEPPAELETEAFLRKDALVRPPEGEATQEENEIPPERIENEVTEDELPEPPHKEA